MIPRIAKRGHSFKGAGLYYFHDVGKDSAERVAWIHTHNIPTDDPDKAMKWMAYTAMNSNKLKQETGVPMTGRKASAGSAYCFSLSWAPDQNPDREKMMGAAFESLDLLGLKDHQAVLVAHRDTDHPHVHVICNLVNPQNGRTAVPSYDRITLSEWAEKYEKENGKVYCEARVENNKKRRELAKEDRQLGMIKHRENRAERFEKIQELYSKSDNGKAFQDALNKAGYTLAGGDRRGFVLVDDEGNIYSLSRQLKGQRAKDIRERLSDIKQSELPLAKALSRDRQHYDREQADIDRQNRELEAADEAGKKEALRENQNRLKEKKLIRKKQEFEKHGNSLKDYKRKIPANDHLKKLDAERQWFTKVQRLRTEHEKKMAEFYRRGEHLEKISELEKRLKTKAQGWGKLSGKLQKLQEELAAHKRTLADIDQKIKWQWGKLEKEIAASKPPELRQSSRKEAPKPAVDFEAEKAKAKEKEAERQRKIKAFKERMRQADQERNERDREHGRDMDL